ITRTLSPASLIFFLSWFAPMRLDPIPASQTNTTSFTSSARFMTMTTPSLSPTGRPERPAGGPRVDEGGYAVAGCLVGDGLGVVGVSVSSTFDGNKRRSIEPTPNETAAAAKTPRNTR